MHDKFKKAHRAARGDDRIRRQIAREAARRLVAARPDAPIAGWIETVTEAEFYTAKRKAAAVLGKTIRPGDLPSDSEIRLEAIALAPGAADFDDPPEPGPDDDLGSLAERIDRFTLYALRLAPLEGVKQDPRTHPEGDALYHSLQVFELARQARPYDEEFLLAALLHDVGKATAGDHRAAGVAAVRGAVGERTLWLIEHHHDLDDNEAARGKPPVTLDPQALEDLALLRECDLAGRIPGRPVEGVDAALAYLRGLEQEDDIN